MKHLVLALVLLLAPTLFAAAAPTPAKTLSLSDAQIERNIKARLARSAKVGRNGFQVKVQGGVATLDGRTNVIQHKGAATRMAKAGGARAVVNNIVISEEARQKAAARLAGVRRAKIETSPASTPRTATVGR